MALTRETGRATLIDVLDRILDKGIVIDAWIRVSLVGIDLLTVEARVVIASIETYLNYADTLAHSRVVSHPPLRVPKRRIEETSEPAIRSRAFAARAGS